MLYFLIFSYSIDRSIGIGMSLAAGGVLVEDLSQGYPEADWDTVLKAAFSSNDKREVQQSREVFGKIEEISIHHKTWNKARVCRHLDAIVRLSCFILPSFFVSTDNQYSCSSPQHF
jgi:hypothetical protein